jgi:hypothetical protein
LAKIFFNGGDGEVEVETLIIHQSENYLSYEIETVHGITYVSPTYRRID